MIISGTRNFILILIANAVLGSAMPMLIILGGLGGMLLAPSPGLVTLPPSIQMLAGLLGAAPMSLFMGRFGRRAGFLVGAGFTAVGGLAGATALYFSSFLLLLFAHILLGVALVCFGYFRFAAGEAVPARWQSVAISFTLGSGLIAALLGPEVFIQTRDMLSAFPLAGPYLAIAVLAIIGAIPVALINLPVAIKTDAERASQKIGWRTLFARPKIVAAMVAGVVSFGVMVLMMTPTPLAMVSNGFSEVHAGDVIRWHVIAMFAPSFVTGFLIQRFGVITIILGGMVCLAMAGGFGLAGMSIHHFYGSLILLGIGWNFGYIGATTLLSSATSVEERAAVQGTNDTLLALSATVMSFASGIIIADAGWHGIAITALPILGVATLAILFLNRLNRTAKPTAGTS